MKFTPAEIFVKLNITVIPFINLSVIVIGYLIAPLLRLSSNLCWKQHIQVRLLSMVVHGVVYNGYSSQQII